MIALLLLAVAAGSGGAALERPEGGWDLRYLEQRQALAYVLFAHVVRIEAVTRLPPPFDPGHPKVEDGVGTVVAPGRLLTTARWLAEADEVWLVLKDRRRLRARRLRVDPRADLALLAFDPKAATGLTPVPEVRPPPPPDPDTGAVEVVVPTTLIGMAPGIRIAAVRPEEAVLYVSGVGANGLPAFDRWGRLVALVQRPTPARDRSVGISGERIAAWLEAAAETRGSGGEEAPRTSAPPSAE